MLKESVKSVACAVCLLSPWFSAAAFEGRINVELARGDETNRLLYSVSRDCVRIEMLPADRPHAVNLIKPATGEVLFLFPHNRSLMHWKPAQALAAGNESRPNLPSFPVPPPGIGPTRELNFPGPPAASLPDASLRLGSVVSTGAGLGNSPMSAPSDPDAKLEAPGEKTNLLGFACLRYEIRQRDEIMEIWATDELLPFAPYLPQQPVCLGPRLITEQWGDLLKAKHIFPLRATLRTVNGPERLRFEVKVITSEKIEDREGRLFQPPADYREVKPLSF